MRFGRRSRATAVAAAVIGGLLGSVVVAPAASAAPAEPGSHAGDRAGRAETPPPPVWPRPQSMRTTGPAVKLGAEATLVAAPDADPYAVEQARALLREAGVRTLHESLPGRGPVVRLGGAGACVSDSIRLFRVRFPVEGGPAVLLVS
ncbi:glycoside hydrolase family 20 zincin-like fold domain-containing protein, partial [Streptomyces californicus]